ncbi:MAG: FGGY family carbohydrate kinase [Oscillospiraceae bacterium]|nr:FGGY family carbohydrate kinase [Oscillospiraceae bacterium]
MAFLGVDLGSSSCKAAVFTENGDMIASSSANYTCVYPKGGFAECEPELIWDAFVRSVRGIGKAGNEVEAMCISTHGETIIPVNKHGGCAANAIMNSDNRAAELTKELENLIGRENFYKITGLPASVTFSIGKIMWLKKYATDIYDKTAVFHSPHSYLLCRMGIAPVCDYTIASRYLAFDMSLCEWSKEILSASEIEKNKLPEIAEAGTICGILSDTTASLLGLNAGIPVVAGGHDQPCAFVGTGVTETGKATVSAGTYEVLGVTSENPPAFDIGVKSGVHTTRHIIKGCYFIFGFFGGGHLSSWIYNLIGGGDYAKYEQEAAAFDAPTNILITPHLTGSGTPDFDENASGIIAGITPAATAGIIYRAAYEGIACELSNIIDIFESAGISFSDLIIFGGNAKSDISVQLRADICNKTFVRTQISDVVARGAAKIAARAVGIDIETGITGTDIFSPLSERAKAYLNQKKKYRLLSKIY